MGIFDFWGVIKAIINPTSSYKNMLDKIESDNEGAIGDRFHGENSVKPEHHFNHLVKDIMNYFVEDLSVEDGDETITEDNR